MIVFDAHTGRRWVALHRIPTNLFGGRDGTHDWKVGLAGCDVGQDVCLRRFRLIAISFNWKAIALWIILFPCVYEFCICKPLSLNVLAPQAFSLRGGFHRCAAEYWRFYKSFQYTLFKSTQLKQALLIPQTRTKSIIISRDFKNLLVLLWRLLQPCPFQSVPPSTRRTTSSTCVPAKDVKNVTRDGTKALVHCDCAPVRGRLSVTHRYVFGIDYVQQLRHNLRAGAEQD